MVGRMRPEEMTMDTLELLRTRYSCRAFLPETPSRETVLAAVEAAGRAPSSKNGQPWMLHVALGPSADRVRGALLAAFDAGTAPAPDYRYSPSELPAEQMERARACGFALFAHKGIAREDKPARRAHDRENYALFGAHAFAVLTLPKVSEKGNFLDGGLFLGAFLAGLRAQGLESTTMYSVAVYPQVLRRELSIPDDRLVVCGISFGKPDLSAHVNSFRTVREPAESLVSWA
jgi:nitroreductase